MLPIAGEPVSIPSQEREALLILDNTDTQALLRLFGWSIDNTEVADARAWYEIIKKDSPSAVRLMSETFIKLITRANPSYP